MKSKRGVNLINCNNQEFWNIKLSKFLTTLSLTATLATAQMVGLPNQKPKEAQAQSSPRPYVVLVNGYQDCCIWSTSNRGVYMLTVLTELQKQGAEFRLVPWDTFRDGAGQRSSTSNDAAFLQEAADYINNQLDPNRPLVLIGHSFGGDSLLSLAPRINRRIQFLGVIDPTAAGGLREPVTRRGVPSNVDYFFNRWEQNALTSANVVPFDSRIVNGSISGCQAKNCDQQEQSLARNENGSEIRVKCGSLEVTCSGYNPIPVALGGSNGTKAKRLAHNDMPSDAYLQRQMANRINQALTVSQSPVVQPQIKSPTSRLWARDPVLSDVAWTPIGHAQNVVAMAGLNGKLFAVTQDNKLWARDPVLSDVAWTPIGHAQNVVAMAGLNGKLFAVTQDNKLWVRDPVLSDVAWTPIGHAQNVVAMAGLNGKLFAVTQDNKLWARDPVLSDVAWTPIGHAQNVVAMAGLNGKLFAVTQDNRLWVRDPVLSDVAWTPIGHAQNVVAMAGLNGKLFVVTP